MKRTLTALTLSAMLVIQSSAQWVATNGPFGGAVRKLAVIGTNLFAATDNVGVSLSTNNGTSWTVVNTGLPANPLVHTLVASGTNLFASVSARGVYHSTDSGTSWTAINNGLTNTNVMALAVSGTNLFVATMGGVFRSTDNGANWTLGSTDLTGTSVPSLAISGSNVFAGTDGRGVFLSTNNGVNWAAANNGFPSPATTTVHSLLASAENVFAGYHRGVVLSTNNASTWAATNTGFPNATINVMSLVASGGNLFAATSGSGVFRSTNNGASWATFNTGLLNTTVMSLAVVGTELFAGTFGSGVWRQAIPTGVKEVSGTNPETFSLEQNYPNPFNPSTRIKFRIGDVGGQRPTLSVAEGSEVSRVMLKVYDVLGREVATLVDEELEAGSYEVNFDARDLASGVYFYRMTVHGFADTRRLLLLR
ncbi:MAG: T9SS type A sorting domain-containing protein [Ignavibacteriae bacterium]|nr:T9SS type A sorting domain-containing protein [Ignavibacteriota bacterium]